MKKFTIFIAVVAFAFNVNAQQTFDLDWAIGINGAAASVTIETGDTVRWTWTDSAPHTVTSLASSQETFDSGTLTGLGEQFSYTFTEAGVNDYRCEIHPGTMFGAITVNEGLAVEDKFVQNINWFPNPVQDQLTVTSLFKLEAYQITNVLGKTVDSGNQETNVLNVDMSTFAQGVYFVTLKSGDLQTTLQVIKK
ncbi:MAG: T9SS type A sorting domain-containing protein [Flavobacteriaceae bacterium]|nr:T9SS type A sorting domain-containing protein [Flavobacteriaceae bacterium]